jgi:hypothetical protein
MTMGTASSYEKTEINTVATFVLHINILNEVRGVGCFQRC